MKRVTPIGEVNPSSKNIKFETLPDLDAYDALIFGAPVQAFSLSAVMKTYMNQIKSLNDKKVACFVTKGVAFNWTGGNKAISQMKKIIESQGGTVIGSSHRNLER